VSLRSPRSCVRCSRGLSGPSAYCSDCNERVDRALRRWADGDRDLNMEEIGAEFGLTAHAVLKRLKRMGHAST
jgi:hypothetical protein